MPVVVAVMIAVVVALRRRDDTPCVEQGERQQQAAHYHSCCVFHGMSLCTQNLRFECLIRAAEMLQGSSLIFSPESAPRAVGLRTAS
jgi:hypothetical protein